MIVSDGKMGVCGCCGRTECQCASCSYIVVLKFCNPGQINGQEYDLSFTDDTTHDIGTITTDNIPPVHIEGSCNCRVFVVGDVDTACPTLLTDLGTLYTPACVTPVQTTVMNNVVLTGCTDVGNPGIISFEIHPHTPIDALPPIGYDLYRICDGECCKFQSGMVTVEGTNGVINWHNPCCLDGDGNPFPPPPICNGCCVCQQAPPGTFFYPVWKVTVTGVIDNPFYTIDGGNPSCNCNQFNGTFYLVMVGSCCYASTATVPFPVDAIAFPNAFCSSRQNTDLCVGAVGGVHYPLFQMDCNTLLVNMCGPQGLGGTCGPTFVSNPGLGPGNVYLANCAKQSLFIVPGSEFPHPTPVGIAPPPAVFFLTPCTTLNSTVTIEPVGAPTLCTPVGMGRAGMMSTEEALKAPAKQMLAAAMAGAVYVSGNKVEAVPPRKKCKFRGEDTGKTVICQPCGGRVELKIFDCELHGSCTIGKEVEGQACCATCNDWIVA